MSCESVDWAAGVLEGLLMLKGYSCKRVTEGLRDDAMILRCDSFDIPLTRMNTTGFKDVAEMIEKFHEMISHIPNKS